MLIPTLMLLTLGQYDYEQRQFDTQQYQNQQYRYEAAQQSAQYRQAAQNQSFALQGKAAIDAMKAQASSKRAPLECRPVDVATLKPLGGRFDENNNVLTVFLEDTSGGLFTFKAAFDGPARARVTAARLAFESSSGMELVSVGWKHGETGHSGAGSARRFKALFTGVTLHTAAAVFQPSPAPDDCLVIARVAIDVPWYD